tara:strand:- start:400 stop:813 length:414 start_codon:yes stop_codon:yes gene_type:complete
MKNASTYMKMAVMWGDNSTSKRNKVGCLIVKDECIISDGYNGTPSGFPNECEWEVEGKLQTKAEVLHAESNAIAKLAGSTRNCRHASLFTTLAPCWDCAKIIIQCRIKEVYYKDDYNTDEGIVLLNRAGITTIKLDV